MTSNRQSKGIRSRQGRPGFTLAAVSVGLFMVGLDATVVHIANPAIAADLNTSFAQLQWITNAYLLVLAVFLILGGKLGDRYGSKRLYLIGVSLFGLTSLGIGLIGSAEGVIAMRGLQGLSAAILLPQTLALLRATFPKEQFGMAIGIWGGVSSIAIALGPIVSGVLVAHVGWESIFFINIPIAVAGVVFGTVFIKELIGNPESRLDIPGVVLLAAGMGALIFGVVQGESWGWGSAAVWAILGVGVVFFVIFALVESRTADPLLPMELFYSPNIPIGGLIFVANFFAIMGLTFILTLFLMNTRGSDTVLAGLQMMPMSVVSIFAPIIGAVLVSKMGASRTAALGLLMMTAALWGITLSDAATPYWWLAAAFVVLSLGSGFAIPSGAEIIMGGAPARLAGVAGGFQTTGIQIGGAFGTSVLAAIISLNIEKTTEVLGLSHEAVQGLAQGIVPAGLTPADASIARGAFVDGLHHASITAAVLAAVVAVLTLLFVRDRVVDFETVMEETIEGEAGHI